LEAEKRAASSTGAVASQTTIVEAAAERTLPPVLPESRATNSETRAVNSPKAQNPTDTQAAADRGVLDFFRDTTFNVTLDGYYSYNFNRPVGRINLLRAYDVSSNSFSLNQATIVIE